MPTTATLPMTACTSTTSTFDRLLCVRGVLLRRRCIGVSPLVCVCVCVCVWTWCRVLPCTCVDVCPQDSGLPLTSSPLGRDPNWPKREDTRPDVFLINHAAAYTAWYSVSRRCRTVHVPPRRGDAVSVLQNTGNHTRWLREFLEYIDNGRMITDPPAVAGT
jgi:hypothetical protein